MGVLLYTYFIMNNQQLTTSEFLLYTSPSGDVSVSVYLYDESIWMNQKRMSELFGVAVNTINHHIAEVYESGELSREATIRNFRIVQQEGERDVEREVQFYNLDMIVSVGYRVNSQQATQFRIWATNTLKEYILKGFIVDVDRLKNGEKFGKDYFEELLEKIREIRASERRFYQKITDIYSTAIDYNASAITTKDFFAAVQNKLEWAVTGSTAPELISERADSTKPNMGLTTWKNAPSGKVLKSDTTIAKNYLRESELKELNRIVTMYLDYAELQAERQIPMKMTDWVKRLDAFLQFNEYQILQDAGKVQAAVAKKLAEKEYEKFRVQQDRNFESDFDKAVKNLKKPSVKKNKNSPPTP